MRILCGATLAAKVQAELAKIPRDQIKGLLGLRRFKEAEMTLPSTRLIEPAIEFRCRGIACLKAFRAVHRSARDGDFPVCTIFHKWFQRVERLLETLPDASRCALGQRLGFVDSMKLPIGFEGRFMKAMGKAAGVGHSSCGRHYGLKLHALVREDGLLCSSRLTAGNVHDLVPVKEGLLAGQVGRIYGDRGYVSREVRFDLTGRGIDFWARPRENMGSETEWSFYYVREFEARHSLAYRKRMGIERFFARLKRGFWPTLPGLRSRRMAASHVAAAMLASQWLALGELKARLV